MTTLQIRIDETLREKAAATAHGMGLDLSTAVRMFLAQMVKENGLPFHPTNDPFYSSSNLAALRRSLDQLDAGNTVSVTLEELEGAEG